MKLLHPDSQLFRDIPTEDLTSYPSVTLADLSQMAPHTKGPKKTLVASEAMEPAQVVFHFLATGAVSLLQKNKTNFHEDLMRTAEFIHTPDVYFSAPGSHIAGSNSKSCEVTFSTSLDKPNLKRELDAFLGRTQNQNVMESAEAVTEELYMNAMLDAPREAAKLGQINCTYDLGMHSTIRMHLTKDRLIISCEDPFGSLDPRKFVNRMQEVYIKGAGESINFREGGAGLGCVIIFEHCESMFLGVIPGQKTLVTAVIPVGLSYRQRAQIKKSLHLISV